MRAVLASGGTCSMVVVAAFDDRRKALGAERALHMAHPGLGGFGQMVKESKKLDRNEALKEAQSVTKLGRPPKGEAAMSPAERQRAYRERKRNRKDSEP